MVFQSSIRTENLIRSRIIGKVGEKSLKDGNFEEACFYFPREICFLSNKPIGFICDFSNHCIRMIDFGKESLTTIAGSKERKAGHQEGKGQNSLFYFPNSIVVNKGQNLLFVSDQYNHVNANTPNFITFKWRRCAQHPNPTKEQQNNRKTKQNNRIHKINKFKFKFENRKCANPLLRMLNNNNKISKHLRSPKSYSFAILMFWSANFFDSRFVNKWGSILFSIDFFQH